MKVSYLANIYEVNVSVDAEGMFVVNFDSSNDGSRLTFSRINFVSDKDIKVVNEDQELDTVMSLSVKEAYMNGFDDGQYYRVTTNEKLKRETLDTIYNKGFDDGYDAGYSNAYDGGR